MYFLFNLTWYSIHINIVLALQIRAGQQSTTANLWPLTVHIYHTMIITQELTFKLMTDFFNKRTFLLHLEASGHRHKILLSVNKLCMTHLYPQGNFVSL